MPRRYRADTPRHRPVQAALWFSVLLTVITAANAAAGRMGGVSASSVLVVRNDASPDSVAIADHYVRRRHIPAANVCPIACPIAEECSLQEYRDLIETPIRNFIAASRRPIDYIVLTKGVPLRTHEGFHGGFGTDSLLTVMDLKNTVQDEATHLPRLINPYFGQRRQFSHARYGFYLVTRLDGYTRADCLRTIDDSLAAVPREGLFLLHTGPGHENDGYKPVNDGMRRAEAALTGRHLHCLLSTGDTFDGSYRDLMGYFSWGSNDARFNKNAYHSLRFAPGSIAETAVSTSARTLSNPNAFGQSLIADLIAQGVTGCKGYVSEPFADSIAHADILFDRYTEGYNLAESFYMASNFLRWKDVVIGDPLCAPYAAK